MAPPEDSDTWIDLTGEHLPVEAASRWAVVPRCGAVVTFNGTGRDHSKGRPDVSALEYEAYEDQVRPRLWAVAEEARVRWPAIGRIAMIHRTGPVQIGESAVVVAVSSPHREEAFSAARFCIDTLKATAPIWKTETWAGGQSRGLEPQHVTEVRDHVVEEGSR
ncbi:MAG: molybdenum cofactor biosynthesis protein MoaE [Acidimicrobiales bacterium]